MNSNSNSNSKRMTNRDLLAAERKQQILEIAKRLFAEKGYHATSMREINREIGMAEALTYHYFPGGKLEILNAVLQHEQEQRIGSIVGFFRETFAKDLLLRDVLLLLIQGLAERILNDQPYFQILFREWNMLVSEQREAINELTQQPFEAMEAFLRHRYALGQIRNMDFGIAASQFLSHNVFLIVQQIIKGQPWVKADMERTADFYTQMWSK